VKILKDVFSTFDLVNVPRVQNSQADLLSKLASSKKGNTLICHPRDFENSKGNPSGTIQRKQGRLNRYLEDIICPISSRRVTPLRSHRSEDRKKERKLIYYGGWSPPPIWFHTPAPHLHKQRSMCPSNVQAP